MSTSYLLERAFVDGEVRDQVLVTVQDGRFVADPAEAEPITVPGLTIPGLANCHSHAFHRALRGRTQTGSGTFWTWREQMYAVAERLTPETYYELALATYREMLCAGITSVGEFHYLHHQPDGTPYDDPNAMGHALLRAASDAGIRIALLDTCYLAAGPDQEPQGVQLRFSDGDAHRWRKRVDDLVPTAATSVVGAAIHSVRAVPREQLHLVAGWAEERGAPLHVHLSEQVAENDACLEAHGMTPTELLASEGALPAGTTVVHATHLSESDIYQLGLAKAFACFCPTTERDLGDGIGPSRQLSEAGLRLTLGSDSHAVVDLFEEMRAVELDERLATRQRGHWRAAELLRAATADGQRSLGFADAGEIAVGRRADLVTLNLSSPRTAGTGGDAETAVFAAVAEDVVAVMVDGVLHDVRAMRADVGRDLDRAIGGLWA